MHDNTPAVIDDDRILKAAAALGLVSSGGHAAPRILSRLCDPAVDAAEVAAVIDGDPGLTARVLRVANSAFYGVSRAVGTVDRAVVVLGLEAIRGVAAAACLDRALQRRGEAAPVDAEALLRHCLATAAAAEAIARLRHGDLAGDAFIAGLLHDFGVVIQVRLDLDGVEHMCRTLREDPTRDVLVVESERVQVAHERCVATIFESWRLPAPLVAATRHHHRPEDAPPEHRLLAALVHVGDQLSLACDVGFSCEPAAGTRSEYAMRALGLTDDDLAPIAAALNDRVGILRQALA